ncbi:hypothetical protein LP417_35175 (plasmid) [Polaromonas sp. P1-6]|nr:hypothetical protein LP417_35175 [Polaromonas sp. P1-6]
MLLSTVAREQQARLTGTWKTIVRSVLMALGGSSKLDAIYEKLASAAPERLSANPHWREKVRQVLNSHAGLFKSEQRGVWALA